MADLNELVMALKNADAAGDTEAAAKLSTAIRAAQSGGGVISTKPAVRINPIGAASQEFAQQFTGGYSDELSAGLAAAVKSPFSERTFDDIYDEQLGTERANLAAGREQHLPSDIVGGAVGLFNPKSAASLLPKLGSKLFPTASRVLPTWLRASGAGAAGGAVYGAGASEGDLSDRATDAAVGGATGAVLAPIVSSIAKPVITGSRNMLKLLMDKLTATPKREAERLVSDAVRNDLLTPDDVLRLKANPNLVVADLGENVAGLARGAAAKPGPFRTAATKFLRGRQEGQMGRLVESLGIKGPQEFKDGFDDWAASRIKSAGPKYDEAYAASFDASSPQMQALLKKPAMQAALEEAERKIANETGVKGGNVQRLDFAKRSLDDMRGTALRAGKDDEARIILNIKRELTSEMDRQVPAYREARSIFAGEAAVREAADSGANLFSRSASHDEARRAVADMTPSEFEAFRRGAFRGLVDLLENTPENRNAAQKLIESSAVRDKVRLMFQNQDDFVKFVKSAVDESRMSYTKNFVTGGSPTARIQEESRAITEAGQIITDAATGNHMGLFGRFLRTMGFGEPSQETLNELGKLLFTNPSPQMLNSIGRASRTPLPGPITPGTQVRVGGATGAAIGGVLD